MISWDTSNPIFGATTNPHKSGRGVGGSSGGEAALVAGGGSVIGVGGDIGGSIRIPAHMCGIFAFKPTAHRIRYEYRFIFIVTCKLVSSTLMVHVLNSILIYYRPQRSCGKVIFSQASVSHSVHRGEGRSGRYPRAHPLGTHTQAQTPPPLGRHPLGRHPPVRTTPPPPGGHCSGQYASYWNAFLLQSIFSNDK